MKRAQSTRRVGFTLSELLVVVALVAIGAAIALSVKKEFTKSHFSVQQLGFSADGGRLLAMSHDGEVKAWDAVSGKQVGSLQPSPLSCPKSAISSDGRTVARLVYKKPNYAYQDGFHVDVFDIETGKRLSRRSRDSFDDLAFSPDGKLLTVWSNNAIELFDPLDSGEAEFSLPSEKSERPKAGYWSLSEVTFGPQHSVIYAINSDDELFRWDTATGEERRADIVLPSAKGSTSKLAVSPDGQRLAILKYDTAKPLQPLSIELRDAGSLSANFEKTLDSQPSEIAGFAFADSGKSLVMLGDDFEFFDSETLEQQKQRTQSVSNRTAKQMALYGGLAVGPDGKRLALADLNTIDLYEDGTMRRLVDDSFSGLDFFLWLLLFNAVMMLFFYMRRRNKTKTCSQCGKDWIPVDRSRDPRCPDCRLLAASTEELRRQQQKTKHQVIWRLLALLPVIVFLPLIGRAGNLTTNPLDYLETFFGTLLVVVFYGGGGLAIFFVVSILANHWRIRRLRSVDRSLARAQKAASSTGRIDEFGPITLWTDAAEPLSETAESIAGRLASCRRRIEELTGEACPPVHPLLLLAFSTSAAARRYSPVPRFDPDRNTLYLGPYANQGFFSLEMSRRLVPLSVITGGLLMPHCLKPAKKGLRLWWNLGLGGFLAVENLPSEPSHCRRQLAVWHRENSLIPLEELYKQRLRFFFTAPTAGLLPEHHERYLKIVNQCTSLVDYFCGHDAPPERREQFKRLWQAVQQERKLDAACQAALGYNAAQLEEEWKAWVASATFDPPAEAPPEIVAIAQQEVIPTAHDIAAPIQLRIKAIRTLGSCGWSVGIEPLQALITDSEPDVQREAKRALQLLCGPLGTAAS